MQYVAFIPLSVDSLSMFSISSKSSSKLLGSLCLYPFMSGFLSGCVSNSTSGTCCLKAVDSEYR